MRTGTSVLPKQAKPRGHETTVSSECPVDSTTQLPRPVGGDATASSLAPRRDTGRGGGT